ncbi:MAG: plastocyanin/azurin family copper-binding protein [Nitrospirota bacterium]|nr:plastocyanin/azurin family copper-binding protein [Nitrospirota bacterium]
MSKTFISLVILIGIVAGTQNAEAKFGWAAADIALDFGVDVEPGERQIIIDQAEVGQPFDVDVVWRLAPRDCLIQTLQAKKEDGSPEWQTLQDDQLFNRNPMHAIASNIETLAVAAKTDKPCHMDPMQDELLVVSEITHQESKRTHKRSPAPLGVTVMVLRATSFFTPNVVTIHVGERVVWIYADGAKEPHTATSGACRGTDCTGGGKNFDSGKTLNKAGHRFEHVFKHPGTFPYHCDLHTASMVGTVIVKPKTPANESKN